ncbi:hypothetical protein ACTFIW_005445 [Dictyostelium discoideum]
MIFQELCNYLNIGPTIKNYKNYKGETFMIVKETMSLLNTSQLKLFYQIIKELQTIDGTFQEVLTKQSVYSIPIQIQQLKYSRVVYKVTRIMTGISKLGPSSAKNQEICDANLVFKHLSKIKVIHMYTYTALLNKTLVLCKIFGLARSSHLVKWSASVKSEWDDCILQCDYLCL